MKSFNIREQLNLTWLYNIENVIKTLITVFKNREGMTIPPRKNREGMTMGSHFFMRVAARRRRALATLMKKCEPMNLLSQFCVEVGLLW